LQRSQNANPADRPLVSQNSNLNGWKLIEFHTLPLSRNSKKIHQVIIRKQKVSDKHHVHRMLPTMWIDQPWMIDEQVWLIPIQKGAIL